LAPVRIRYRVSADDRTDGHKRKGVEEAPHEGGAIQRHCDCATQISIAEQRMWPGFVRGIAQIESQKRVRHTGQRVRPDIRMTRRITQVLRVEAIEDIDISAKSLRGRGRVIR
jgi:hypothetical protein